MYSGELSAVAAALLSITASEAAVERSFSAQGAVHTKKRNRLLDHSVQNEMFVKFNRSALDRRVTLPELSSFSCIDLSPDIDFSAALEPSSDDETEPEEPVDSAVGASAGNAAASSAAAAAAAVASPAATATAPVRSQTILDSEMRQLLERYIEEHHITLVSIANRRYWNGDRRNPLQIAIGPGGYLIDYAIAAIKGILEEQHNDS